MKKYIFPVSIVLLIVLANLWCYIENERLLKGATNFFMIFVSYIAIKTNSNYGSIRNKQDSHKR